MGWLAGIRKQSATATAAAVAPEPPPPNERHAAPGLVQAFARLEGRPRRILDLGPPLHANLTRYARLAPRLAIGDLTGALEDGLSPIAAIDEAFSGLRLGGPSEPFELVLAWDLPNHLGREALPRLAAILAPRCSQGCHFYALLEAGKTMPALPRRYRIREEELEQECSTGEEIPSPRLMPGELDRVLPGFVVDKSRLLAHGVQEVLMQRTDHAEVPITRQAPLRRELRKTLPRGRQSMPPRRRP
ncbi:MAG: hypothetical protein KDB94_11710 [Acidobacteria bacterium]|nr:hypothetical protein [Acidobacteriota bacterium]